MGEKRFIRNIMGDIYDSETDNWFEEDWKDKPLDYDDDLIIFLNEQESTIKELQKKIRVLEKKCRVISGLENEQNCKVKQGENVNLSDYLEVDKMKNITKIRIVDFIDDLIHERIDGCDK